MQDKTERMLPQNRDAERSVLGSILRAPPVLDDIRQIIRSEDFYTDAHQKIFTAMVNLQDEQLPIDLVVLAEHFKEQKQLEDIGGYPYLAELWEAAPTAANAVYYAQIVRDKARVRNLILTCTEILRDAYDQAQPAGQLLDAAEQRLFDLSQRRPQVEILPFRQVALLVADDIDRRSTTRKAAGLPTGFIDLDRLLGGLQEGETVIVGARTSVGKTSFAANIAYHVAANPNPIERVPVLFISHEQDAVEIGRKLICMHAEVKGNRVRAGTIDGDEADKLAGAIRCLSEIPLWINKTPISNIEQIQSIARAWKAKHGIGLLVIDYLQLTKTEVTHKSMYEAVTAVSQQAKQLARSLQIPVILPAQLNREVKAGDEPTLATLRDSGAIEQDADIVLLLWQADEAGAGNADRVIKVKIAKQRNGPLGTVTLFFRGDTQRFENHEPKSPFEDPRQ